MCAMSIDTNATRVLLPEFDRRYPVAVRGDGVWLEDSAGRRYLDAMSGGSMAATLGYGRRDIIETARRQAARLAYVHNERLTNPLQEQFAQELCEVAPPGFARVRFVTGGAEANEMAIRFARAYHVERGEPDRWQVISQAQAYHGPTMLTLALTGRPGLQGPLGPYLARHLHIPPSTRWLDPTGQAALDALDLALEEAGPKNVAAFFCEPISAAALPAHSPPTLFWEGLEERRRRHGFLVCFDEIVTGMGRVGSWFAGCETPIVPDLIATAKGLGAGYAPIGASSWRTTSTRRSRTGRASSRSGTPGTGRRSRARSDSPSWMSFVRGARRTRARTGSAAPLRARRRAGRDRHRGRGARSWLSPRRRLCGPARRWRLSSAPSPRRRPDRRGRARTGSHDPLDPADARRNGGRPEPVRASLHDDATRSSKRWSPASRTRCGTSQRTSSPSSSTSVPSLPRREPVGVGDSGAFRALVVEHERATPGGRVFDWLEDHGAEVDELRIDVDGREIDVADYSLLVSLGSEFAPYRRPRSVDPA